MAERPSIEPSRSGRRDGAAPELDIPAEVAALERMTARQLHDKFGEVFGEQTQSNNRVWLIWRIQANAYGGIFAGLLKCRAWGCAMSHSHTSKGSRLYRYYVCLQAQKRGYAACPSPSVSAPEIERFVVDEVKALGRDPRILADTLAALKHQTTEAIESLAGEIRTRGPT